MRNARDRLHCRGKIVHQAWVDACKPIQAVKRRRGSLEDVWADQVPGEGRARFVDLFHVHRGV